MPRTQNPLPKRIPPILRTRHRNLGRHGELIRPGMPRLWNAKRRIKTSQGLSHAHFEQYKANPTTFPWHKHVSHDVASFLSANPNLSAQEKANVLSSPARFFSRSHNVPTSQRKQIYFPDFSVTLLRTPHNSPYFATFKVPLWFNKLDLKSYLDTLYSVSVIHIRSFVTPSRISRMDSYSRRMRGPIFRIPSEKKMTVQLVDPFVWPEEITDFAEWEREEYWRVAKAQLDHQRHEGQWGMMNPNQRHRKSIADQARELLEGKRQWKPTWQEIPADERVLKGVADIMPRIAAKTTTTTTTPQISGRQRKMLRSVPVEKSIPIDAPVKEMSELRV